MCAQLCARRLHGHPLHESSPTHFTDEGMEAHRAAAAGPSSSAMAQTWAGPRAVCGERPSYPIGRLEAPVIGDVLPEGVPAVHRLPVHAVVAVLLHHALGLPLESLHGRVLPPGPEVPVLVILASCRGRGKRQVKGRRRRTGTCCCCCTSPPICHPRWGDVPLSLKSRANEPIWVGAGDGGR